MSPTDLTNRLVEFRFVAAYEDEVPLTREANGEVKAYARSGACEKCIGFHQPSTLSNKKDEALEKYISNKEMYGEESDVTKESLKVLKTAKEELNNHPLVKEYLEVYSRVRDLYLEIDNLLLDDFKRGHC